MKDKMVELIEKFYNDIIGYLIPGTLFLACISIFIVPNTLVDSILNQLPTLNGLVVFIFLCIAMIVGHALAEVGNCFFFTKKDYSKILNSKIVTQFKDTFSDIIDEGIVKESKQLSHLRSYALHKKKEDNYLIYKFMFLSHFCLSSCLSLFAFLILFIIHMKEPMNPLLFINHKFNWNTVTIVFFFIILILLIVFLFIRGRDFRFRALKMPFYLDMNDTRVNNSSQLIYLSGGFKSNWQDRVIKKLHGYQFIDPRVHNLSKPEDYTEWDLRGIRESDVVFAYLEESNDRPMGLILEVGYAKALNKKIILIDERSKLYHDNRYSMTIACSDFVFDNITAAISFLIKNPI